VTNVDNVALGGNSYKQLYLSPSSDANVQVNGKVNARFGSIGGYILPFGRSCDGTIVEFDQISLICFQDDSLYYNPTGGACESYLGLNEMEMNAISVFPNPTSGIMKVLSEGILSRLEVFDSYGRLCIIQFPNLTLTELDLSVLNSGIYLLKITTNTDQVIIKRVQRN
jgi:hypothetical protein